MPGRYCRVPTGLDRISLRPLTPQVGDLGLQRIDLGLQVEHPAYAGKGEPLVDETDDLLDPADVIAAIAALAAVRARGGDEVVLLDATQEGLLHVEQLGHLADGEERPAMVGDRPHGRPLRTGGHQLWICGCAGPLRISIRRGRAFSASFMVSVRTPSAESAVTLSASTQSGIRSRRVIDPSNRSCSSTCSPSPYAECRSTDSVSVWFSTVTPIFSAGTPGRSTRTTSSSPRRTTSIGSVPPSAPNARLVSRSNSARKGSKRSSSIGHTS